jgi:hypothetical protein
MMKKMGVESAIRAATVHEPGTQLIDINGRTKAFFPASRTVLGSRVSPQNTRSCAVI